MTNDLETRPGVADSDVNVHPGRYDCNRDALLCPARENLLADNARLREALAAVDELWTIDAGLGFEEEMKAPSPVGIVWAKVRACCNGK